MFFFWGYWDCNSMTIHENSMNNMDNINIFMESWDKKGRVIPRKHPGGYPLVMTNSSPWKPRPIEIDGLPFLIAWWIFHGKL